LREFKETEITDTELRIKTKSASFLPYNTKLYPATICHIFILFLTVKMIPTFKPYG